MERPNIINTGAVFSKSAPRSIWPPEARGMKKDEYHKMFEFENDYW
jgi:hypothetical protein